MNKVALITGGSRGIGLGIAHSLAGEGCDLVICGVRAADQVSEPLAALRERGVDVLYCQADVSDREARARLLRSPATKAPRRAAGLIPSRKAIIFTASARPTASRCRRSFSRMGSNPQPFILGSN